MRFTAALLCVFFAVLSAMNMFIFSLHRHELIKNGSNWHSVGAVGSLILASIILYALTATTSSREK